MGIRPDEVRITTRGKEEKVVTEEKTVDEAMREANDKLQWNWKSRIQHTRTRNVTNVAIGDTSDLIARRELRD